MPIRAGKLNKPATLEKVTRTTDDIGGSTESWATAHDPYWVSIEPLRGSSNFDVGQRFSSVTHKVEGRYLDGIRAETHRIKYGDRIFRIEACHNPMERNETIEFLCEESYAKPEQQS